MEGRIAINRIMLTIILKTMLRICGSNGCLLIACLAVPLISLFHRSTYSSSANDGRIPSPKHSNARSL